MTDVQYVMVTTWNDHWNLLETRKTRSTRTSFGKSLIHINKSANDAWPDRAKTLFIKKDQENGPSRCWIGYSGRFEKGPRNNKEAVWFNVFDLEEIEWSDDFEKFDIGWRDHPSFVQQRLLRQPPFFEELASDNDWQKFEDNIYLLLRLIGINNIHKILPEDNRGKADGFFKLDRLSVLYDVTLEDNFEKKKKTQFDNYIKQLKDNPYRISNCEYNIDNANKQVWIITRNSEAKKLINHEDITVKVIPYTSLVELYHYRLEYGITQIELCEKLSSL